MKRTLVYSIRAKERRQSIALLHLTWDCVLGSIKCVAVLCMSANNCERAEGIDLEVTNKCYCTGKSTHAESMGNENWLHVSKVSYNSP